MQHFRIRCTANLAVVTRFNYGNKKKYNLQVEQQYE
jgi:hypothetical protein